MFGYALYLGWRGLRRFPSISILSVLALALGIGATVTAHTVTRLLAGNPIPSRNGELYVVRVDARLVAENDKRHVTQVPDRLTWLDVRRLEQERPDIPQTAIVNTAPLEVVGTNRPQAASATDVPGLEVQSGFFHMFDVPFIFGSAWSHADDIRSTPVTVISTKLAQKLFGTQNATGKTIYISQKPYRVVGVVGPWAPYPHFYGLHECIYACADEQIFIPVSSGRSQNVALYSTKIGGDCDSGHGTLSAGRCMYLGFWALLKTSAQRVDYHNMIVHYARAQKSAGRFVRAGPETVRLQDVRTYLRSYHVVPVSARFGLWVAVVFLLVCLVNVAGLLLTRFMRGSVELGIRRALGATRRAIFLQCLSEAGLLGLAGGLVALPLVWAGLWLVRLQPVAYSSIVDMHWPACIALLVLSVASVALIGVLPAWRASIVEPGLQVREQ